MAHHVAGNARQIALIPGVLPSRSDLHPVVRRLANRAPILYVYVMNPKEYKRRTHEPDAFVRHALEDTLRALSERAAPQRALVELIEVILAGPVIEKPERHRDRVGEDSDFLSVSRVSKEEAWAIAGVFFDLEAACVDANGEITGLGSYYAGLCDAWTNYWEA